MPSKPAGNSGSTQQVQTQNQVELPAWITAAAQSVMSQADDVASTIPKYQVAPITPGGQTDLQKLQESVGMAAPAFQTAQDATAQGTTWKPDQITPGFLSGTDLTPYMSPYLNQVIDPTLKILDQQRQGANNQTADLAVKTGAFGGSRQDVAEGVNNAQSALYGGQLTGQLLNQGFSTASQNAMADLNRQLTADQSNQAAGVQGQQLRLNASKQLGDLAGQGQTANLQSIMAALGGQTQLQQQTQAELDAPTQDALRRLQIRSSTLSGLPYGQTNTSTQTGPGPTSNPWLTGLGTLGTVASIAGSVAPLISDRTMKTDIKKIGKDEETDLPLYSYRYRGDPKTYPKVVGIMAQDAQKKYPDQVLEIGGKLAVRSSFLNGIMERANGNP